MRPREQSRGQDDLFRARLDQIIDMGHELVRLGEADAVAAAKQYLASVHHADANAAEGRVLEAYREILIQAENGKYNTAKWRLQRALEDRDRQVRQAAEDLLGD